MWRPTSIALWSIISLFGQTVQKNLATVPSDLLAQLKQDIGIDTYTQKCLGDNLLRFDQSISTEWLSLNAPVGPSLLVQGLGPCLSGASNSPLLLYAKFHGGWRRVLDGTGERLGKLNTFTKSWSDVELLEHDSAFSSIRYVYKFDGRKYQAVVCNVVQFADSAAGKAFTKPRYGPCTWDWKR